MVAFGLSPVDIRIKRPKFAWLSKDMKAVTEGESCSQVSVTEHNQTEPHDNHSQCTSDEINSQDLFITQKTFRASPVEPSSSEASDGPTAASPQVFKQRDKGRHTAEREIKHKHPQNSYSHQLCGASQKFVRELKTVGKAKEDKKIHEQPQLEKTSFQTPTKVKANLAEGKKTSLSLRPKVVNPFLDEPIIINPTPATSSSQCSSSFLPQMTQDINDLSPLPPCKVSTSTQTENFFTSELSFYRSFCQKNRKPVHSEDLKPLDLSLPLRVRKDLCLSVNLSAIHIRDEEETLHDQKPSLLAGKMKDKRGVGVSGSPPIKDDEVKKDSSGQSKRTPSPQSDADLKSADTTTSSEDDHHYHCGRRDPIQVKGIQMKLNKPFFFKTKGEGRSPRPESPLMKLSQDIQVKKRR
ncbi:uncharacterized protein LOC121648090 isoform X2 [Melanotaenia boesemani]|uniref:uncharacterized protein LOC121648090 isoform X2 n=1 Tax=Melanotaenia boesemani TaxID=1250792 RepID=UPI001C057B3E|nr:uncharacterized protein LOC121648090 isoform X2 [Melanotaenia boesemani]